jgi:hypothetical protein
MRQSGPIAEIVDDAVVTNAIHLSIDKPRGENPVEDPFV